MQKYTSANTSINSTKMPKIYKLVGKRIEADKTAIDYGCGKFFDNYEIPFKCSGYDPFNRNEKALLNKHYNYALCSNVLNVIAEVEERVKLLEQLKELADVTFITVYEGDKSGIGKETKKDCFQLNRTPGAYIPELVQVFGKGNVTWNRAGYFECRKVVA